MQFVGYMCDNVLPVLSEVATDEVTSEGSTAAVGDVQLELLKLLAEMSPYCVADPADNVEESLTKLFNKLLVSTVRDFGKKYSTFMCEP